ncbi:MAG TPA: hypothetical protein VFO10_31010 [Oligoflexus sp.]|uniref:hypothetical protein n=1 Tax=Oligoflexus sp. TaxID=1971216 RepID=UPI002D7F518C|nr:hypothetical protein [Oligoflexus sp.]HET9241739.1 hypothetical protein [Oligoflexus sp.]
MKLPSWVGTVLILVSAPQLLAETSPLELAPLAPNAAADILHNEEVWQAAQAFELTYSVIDHAKPRFRTVYKMVYDADALYFEIMSYDDDMSQVRRKYGLRDQPMSEDDDRVSVMIDPTGHRKFGQLIGVNAACVPYDAVIDEVNSYLDIAPQFTFTAECESLPDGWRVRMKLPFHELKYKTSPTVITLLVERRYLRESFGLLTSSPLEYFGSCILCKAQQFTLTPPPKQNHIKAVVEAFASREDQGGERRNRENLGVTVSLPLAAGTRLDGTWRPDYSQVEDDSPYLQANSPFPLPKREKRPFFLEGNDILFAPLFSSAQSRSIVSPTYGLKLLSRHEHYKVFALAAGDQSQVYRLRPGTYQSEYVEARTTSQNIMTRGSWNADEHLTLGLGFNGKQEKDLYENAVGSADLTYKFNATHRVTAQFLSSRTENKADGVLDAYEEKGRAQAIAYDYSGDQTMFNIAGKRTEAGFVNDLGFMPERGTQELNFFGSWSTQLKKPEWMLSDLLFNINGARRYEDESKALMASSVALEAVYETDHWMTFYYAWAPRDIQRVDFGGELHEGNAQKAGFTLRPPRYLSLLECSYLWGHATVYSEDSLGRNRKTSCRIGVSLGLHVSLEYAHDHDNYQIEALDHGLDERVQNGILRVFFSRNLFMRITAQQSKITDYAEVVEQKSLSWVLGYQNIEGLSAYCGVNQIRPEVQEDPVSREYFAKLSFTL